MKNRNYLDLIPVKNEAFPFSINEKGVVTIQVEHKGICYKIVQKLFGRSRFTQVHLEEFGNFIWPLIDGKRSVYEIGILVMAEFGEKAEPLYDRLTQYFNILKSNEFITFT